MGLFIGFLIFMVFAFVFASGANRSGNTLASSGLSSGSIWTDGTPARGIMLSVASTGTRTTYGGQRYEIRDARVDIEIPGAPPYEMNTFVYIPSNLVRDVLPGSTMEVRVDPGNQSRVLVVGPDVGYAQGAVRTS